MRVMLPGESDSAEQRDTFEGVLDADGQSGQRSLSRDKSVLILVVLFGPSGIPRCGTGNLGADQHHGRLVLNCLERSEEHTSELQSLMRISYAVFRLKKKK